MTEKIAARLIHAALQARASLKRTVCARRWKMPRSSASITTTNKLKRIQNKSKVFLLDANGRVDETTCAQPVIQCERSNVFFLIHIFSGKPRARFLALLKEAALRMSAIAGNSTS